MHGVTQARFHARTEIFRRWIPRRKTINSSFSSSKQITDFQPNLHGEGESFESVLASSNESVWTETKWITSVLYEREPVKLIWQSKRQRDYLYLSPRGYIPPTVEASEEKAAAILKYSNAAFTKLCERQAAASENFCRLMFLYVYRETLSIIRRTEEKQIPFKSKREFTFYNVSHKLICFSFFTLPFMCLRASRPKHEILRSLDSKIRQKLLYIAVISARWLIASMLATRAI